MQPSKQPSHSEPYGLIEEKVATLTLPNADEVIVACDADSLIDRIAADLVVHALECVRQFGDFHLALSGGSTPEPLYRRLMYDPNYRMLPWRRTHLWIVDERRVPFDDPESNFGMIRELLVIHADIPPEQVHPIPVMNARPDQEYENDLREHLEWREKGQDRLDFVLLGLGSDGHTASLFPFSEAIDEEDHLVRINEGGQTPEGGRVTMTYPLINAARFVAVFAYGEKKAEAIARVAQGTENKQQLPIAGVRPIGGKLHWYLDEDAAARVLWNSETEPPVPE